MARIFRNCQYYWFEKKLVKLQAKNPNELAWGIPIIFSEDQIDSLNVSKTTKKRLHSLKENSILQLGLVSNQCRQAIVVETKYDQEKIEVLEAELKQLNKEIRELVGDKMKRADEIRKELKELR